MAENMRVMITRVLIFLEGIVCIHFLAWGLLLLIYVHFLKYRKSSRAWFAGANKNSYIYRKFLFIEITLRDHSRKGNLRHPWGSLVTERLKSYPRVSEIYLSCIPPVLDAIYPAHSHYSPKSVKIFKNTCSWLNYSSAFYFSIVHQRCEYML